jgi:hypothetical protein
MPLNIGYFLGTCLIPTVISYTFLSKAFQPLGLKRHVIMFLVDWAITTAVWFACYLLAAFIYTTILMAQGLDIKIISEIVSKHIDESVGALAILIAGGYLGYKVTKKVCEKLYVNKRKVKT